MPKIDSEEEQIMAMYAHEEELIRQEVQGHTTMEQLAAQYFLVKTCWNNYDMCIKENMTFERACHTLTHVRDLSFGKAGGQKLSTMAHKLLWEIADTSEPLPEVEATEIQPLRVVH